MKNLIILVISITIFGCVSSHQGFIQPSNVQLNNPNFTLIKTVYGSATATYVFGWGGYKRDGLIKEAKGQMYKKHRFEQNQMITNITLDEKKSWIFAPIVYKKTIMISADIIQFGDIELDKSDLDDNSQVSDSEKLKVDNVIYFKDKKGGDFIEAKVINIEYPYIDISYVDEGKTKKTKKLFSELYLKEGANYRQLKVGK